MIEEFVRQHIRELDPYTSARDDFMGKAQIHLDANENPFESGMNRYPDPYQRELKGRLSGLKDIHSSNIFLGNGSDEIIDLLIRLFCHPQRDSIMVLEPSYGMYSVAASVLEVKTKKIPWEIPEWKLPTKKILEQRIYSDKIIFICNPNNPTGSVLQKDTILKLIPEFHGIVVIDEAYIDFCPEFSMIDKVAEFPNLIVMQTFSKAWGLAGCRLGMAFADSQIVRYLNKIKLPYNVSDITQQTAMAKLLKIEEVSEHVSMINRARDNLKSVLITFPFIEEVYESFANFLLVRVDKPSRLMEFLVDQNIVIRDRSNLLNCAGCVRISVGTPIENESLIKSLYEYEEEKIIDPR